MKNVVVVRHVFASGVSSLRNQVGSIQRVPISFKDWPSSILTRQTKLCKSKFIQKMPPVIRRFRDTAALSADLSQTILQLSKEAINKRNKFTVAFSGGFVRFHESARYLSGNWFVKILAENRGVGSPGSLGQKCGFSVWKMVDILCWWTMRGSWACGIKSSIGYGRTASASRDSGKSNCGHRSAVGKLAR